MAVKIKKTWFDKTNFGRPLRKLEISAVDGFRAFMLDGARRELADSDRPSRDAAVCRTPRQVRHYYSQEGRCLTITDVSGSMMNVTYREINQPRKESLPHSA